MLLAAWTLPPPASQSGSRHTGAPSPVGWSSTDKRVKLAIQDGTAAAAAAAAKVNSNPWTSLIAVAMFACQLRRQGWPCMGGDGGSVMLGRGPFEGVVGKALY
jgi:hypothetical protein